jgi:hypothetical protein
VSNGRICRCRATADGHGRNSDGVSANATSYEWTVPNVKPDWVAFASASYDGTEVSQDQSDADFVIKKRKKAAE